MTQNGHLFIIAGEDFSLQTAVRFAPESLSGFTGICSADIFLDYTGGSSCILMKKERKKAVMLYIQYDFKATVAIRELGYPSERMLRYWYNEYESTHALHIDPRKKPNKYSIEKRLDAVEYYFSHGKCLSSTVRQLGYPHVDTLKSWVNELYPGHFKNRIKTGKVESFSEGQKRTAVITLCSRKCSTYVNSVLTFPEFAGLSFPV